MKQLLQGPSQDFSLELLNILDVFEKPAPRVSLFTYCHLLLFQHRVPVEARNYGIRREAADATLLKCCPWSTVIQLSGDFREFVVSTESLVFTYLFKHKSTPKVAGGIFHAKL